MDYFFVFEMPSFSYSFSLNLSLPKDLTHLPPGRVGQLTHHSTKLAKMPVRTSAAGGPVEPALDGVKLEGYCVP
jgi:hypothetical protein